AISTNVTHFYREERHFDVLADLLRKWEQQGQKRFRLWCAAASTGEEPYTLAITLSENLRQVNDTKILATDISTKVLDTARRGLYDQQKVSKIPPQMRSKYFSAVRQNGGTAYEVAPRLKNMITFARLNLAEPPFPMRGPLDVVFCRNVMIYFDNPVRKRLLDEMYRLLKPGGYLMVGHAESLSGLLSEFKSVAPSIYIKSG
ncbi:MAG: CheR family methyltransferase, partial [Thermodesulfobacteriota bacterium]